MTNEHLDTGPSSIRDDSICEPSLNPNKSNGDIVERTWSPEQFWEFAAAFLGDHEASTSRDMIESRGLALIPTAEIERLRRERDNAYAMSRLQTARRLTAESAVAAAWEGIDKLEGGHLLLLAAVKAGDPSDEIIWRIQEELSVIAKMRSRASAIRAAGGKDG